jgi:hypothetical protein
MQKTFTKELATLQNVDFYGFSSIFPDPDSVMASQGRGISLYRELLHDPHVKACTMSRKSGVVAKPWQLDGEEGLKQTVLAIFDKIDLPRLIQDILNAPLFGYKPIEVVWGFCEGLLAPVRLSAKPQEWFCFDRDSNLRLRTKKASMRAKSSLSANFYARNTTPHTPTRTAKASLICLLASKLQKRRHQNLGIFRGKIRNALGVRQNPPPNLGGRGYSPS